MENPPSPVSAINGASNPLLRAQSLYSANQLTEALAACQTLLATHPNHPAALHMLGIIQCQQGQLFTGIAALERSLALDPDNPDFHNNLGSALGRLSRFDHARTHFHHALRLCPHFPSAAMNCAVNEESAHHWPEAEAAYRRVLQLSPAHRGALYRLGCVLHRLGRYQESQATHLAAFELAAPPAPPPGGFPLLPSPRVVVVVTCKGRLSHLQQTLPGLLNFNTQGDYRVVVVDYADPDNAFDYCRQLAHPRLAALKVLDHAEVFNKNRAANCGALLLPSDLLCFVDADSLLHPDFLQLAADTVRQPGITLARRTVEDASFDTVGVCCARTAAFVAARGYDESLKGYGPEDLDLFARLGQLGTLATLPAWAYPQAIPHTQKERTRFYDAPTTGQSTLAMLHRLADPARTINPSGYGIAQTLHASQETHFTAAPPKNLPT